MRDSRSLATRRRRLRRATLALLLLAGTSVLAEQSYAQQPQNATLRLMPPLPLKSIQASNQVQTNPFCQSPRLDRGVQLASGTASAPVKLKPVGPAVGLQEIRPSQSAPATISIDAPVVSGVQANPMAAQSAIQTSPKTPLGQPQTTIRLVRPNTKLPASGQAVQQAVIPAPQAAIPTTPAPVAPPIEIPATPTQSGPSVPKTTEAPQGVQESTVTPVPPPVEATEQNSGSVASIMKSNPLPKKPALVEESEPIFFSFSDESDALAKEVVEKQEAANFKAKKSNAPMPAAVTIAEPIDTHPQSAPRTVLQKVEPTLENGSSGFATVKIAQPNIRAVVNPFANEESATPSQEPVEIALSDLDSDRIRNQASESEDQISVLTFDPPVILAEAPGITGDLVDPIQFDQDETATIETTEEEGASILATSEEKPETSVERSVLAPIQDVMKSESGEPIAIYRSEPVVAKPVPQGEETLHSKRYRPPVAVKQVPIEFERKDLPTADPAFVKAAVHPVPTKVASAEPAAEIRIDNLGVELGPEVKLTPLHMNQAQVRSLTLGGSVTDVRVGDKDICQAFASGPNQLKLIGTGQGVTRLVVWAAPEGENQKTLMRAFEIHVGDVAPTEGESVADTVHLLNSSIQRAFPNCRANVQLVRGELHVVGQCDNQESAKKIIRMVRKSCLIPVRDQLSVQ